MELWISGMAPVARRLFIIALAATLLISCSSQPGLRLLKHELTVRQFPPGNSPQTQSMAAVTGTAMNPGNTMLTGCVITVTFYDSEKNKLGMAKASRESLGPGEVWDFSIQITGPDAWKARGYTIAPSNK